MSIDVRTSVHLEAIETDGDGRVKALVTSDGTFEADLAVLGTGVEPETTLAAAAGLTLGRWGGLVTDLQMRGFDSEGVWSAGDCVESIDLVSGNRVGTFKYRVTLRDRTNQLLVASNTLRVVWHSP